MQDKYGTRIDHVIKIRDSLMVRMGACRVPDRGSIPRRGDFFADFFNRIISTGCLVSLDVVIKYHSAS